MPTKLPTLVLAVSAVLISTTSGCGTSVSESPSDSPSNAPSSNPTAVADARDATVATSTALTDGFDPDALDVTSATGTFAACDAAGQVRYEVQLAVRSARGDTAGKVRDALVKQDWARGAATYSKEGSTAEIDDSPGAESGSITLTVGGPCLEADAPLGEIEQIALPSD